MALRASFARVQHSPLPTCWPILASHQLAILSEYLLLKSSSSGLVSGRGGGICFCSAFTVPRGLFGSHATRILVIARVALCLMAPMNVRVWREPLELNDVLPM